MALILSIIGLGGWPDVARSREVKASHQDLRQKHNSYLVCLLQEAPRTCCIPTSPTERGGFGTHPQSPFAFQHSSVGCQPLPGQVQTFMSLPSPPCSSPLSTRWAHARPSVDALGVSGQSRDSPGAHAEGPPEHLLLLPYLKVVWGRDAQLCKVR